MGAVVGGILGMLATLFAKQSILPLEYEKQKQELDQEKTRFERYRIDAERKIAEKLEGIPRMTDIIPLNDPIKKVAEELEKQGVATQQSRAALESMAGVLQDSRGDQRKMIGDLARLISSVEQRHERELSALRSEKNAVEEAKIEADRMARRLQTQQFALREEIADRKILAREYSAMSAELAATYLATLEDKSFFKRLPSLITIPADSVKDLLTLNLWDSRKKEEVAKAIEKRLRELSEKDEGLGRKYREY